MRKFLLAVGVTAGIAAFAAAGFWLGRATRGGSLPPSIDLIGDFGLLKEGQPGEGAEEEEELAVVVLPNKPREAQTLYNPRRSAGLVAEVLAWERAFAANAFDLEGDGDLDFLLTLHNVDDDPIWVQRDDGEFEASGITLPRLLDEENFVARDRHTCDAADVDADGDTDLYCTTGFPPDGSIKSNELWLQDESGRFVEKSGHGAEDPNGRGGHVGFFDFDGDEFPDLYVTNFSGEEGRAPNTVFRNRGDATFDAVETAASGSFGGRCPPVTGDWNGDGLDDLAVCPAGTDAPNLYESGNGTLTPADHLLGGTPPEGAWNDAVITDLDGDGWPDLVVATPKYVEIRLNDPGNPDGRFAELLQARKLSDDLPRALAVVDLNDDGLPDIFVATQGSRCQGAVGPNGHDVVLLAPEWRRAPAPYLPLGCGREALAMGDGMVLVVNGLGNTRGATTVLRYEP